MFTVTEYGILQRLEAVVLLFFIDPRRESRRLLVCLALINGLVKENTISNFSS